MTDKISISTVKEINTLHSELEVIVRTGIEKGIRIGELLTDCKEQLQHGEFSAWVEENCSFTLRSAQNYMKLFQRRAEVAGSASITQAYKLLKSEKSESVSFLDKMREYLQHTINEDVEAFSAFEVKQVSDRMPNPRGMTIDQLSAYVTELEEAQQIATECLLRSRRKLGELMTAAESEFNETDRARLKVLQEIYSIHPEIRLHEKGMHVPDDITFEQWQKLGELLLQLKGAVKV